MQDDYREMAEQIVQSDRVYFEMAATVGVINGAEVVWMPELQKLPGGCVVQRVDLSSISGTGSLWLRSVEASIRNLGGTVVRVYVEENNPISERDMLHAGFRRRLEMAYLLPAPPPKRGPFSVQLREVVSDEDWRDRRLLQEECPVSTDGYTSKPAELALLERRKCRTGGMTVYLIERGQEVLGSVGVILIGDLLRCKNLTLRPGAGDQIGVEVIEQLTAMAAHLGLRGMGDLVVAGSESEKNCRDAGMISVARLYEWSKPLA